VKWLVGLLVLVALLVGADRVAEHVAAGVLADRLQTELGSRPTVEIDGFPFLTQAVGGSYQRLRVSAPVVRREGLSLRDFSATLTGVHVALGDALGGSLSAVPVDRLDAGALVAYDDLTQLAGPGLRLAGDPNGVRVTGRVAALGRQVDVSAVSSVALAGDTRAEAWIKTLLQEQLSAQAYGRLLLLPGATAPVALRSRGKAVCSCFNVTEPEINQHLARAVGSPDERLSSVQQALHCGTNCGSCVPELRRLVRSATPTEPAAAACISS